MKWTILNNLKNSCCHFISSGCITSSIRQHHARRAAVIPNWWNLNINSFQLRTTAGINRNVFFPLHIHTTPKWNEYYTTSINRRTLLPTHNINHVFFLYLSQQFMKWSEIISFGLNIGQGLAGVHFRYISLSIVFIR